MLGSNPVLLGLALTTWLDLIHTRLDFLMLLPTDIYGTGSTAYQYQTDGFLWTPPPRCFRASGPRTLASPPLPPPPWDWTRRPRCRPPRLPTPPPQSPPPSLCPWTPCRPSTVAPPPVRVLSSCQLLLLPRRQHRAFMSSPVHRTRK